MSDYQVHRVGAIIIKDRKVLMARDKAEDYFKSPGGKLDGGESAEQAIIRELKEELQLEVKHPDLELFGTYYVPVHDNPSQTVRMDAVLVNNWHGIPRPSDDVEELKWVDSNDLGKTKLGNVFQKFVIPDLHKKGLID